MGRPFPSLEDLPNPGIEPRSPSWQGDSFPAEPQGKPLLRIVKELLSPAHHCIYFLLPTIIAWMNVSLWIVNRMVEKGSIDNWISQTKR